MNIKVKIMTFLILYAVFSLTSCSEPGGIDSIYTVTYDSNGSTGGSVPVDIFTYQLREDTVTVLGNTGNLVKAGDSFVGWNTQADGTGVTFSPGETFIITSNVILYAKWSADYTIGDTGPDGGLIFYDKGSYSDSWRYLEACPFQLFYTDWGGNGTVTKATGMDIGDGSANTDIIVSTLGEGTYAAKRCDNMGGSGDWFLPSISELSLMYKNLHLKGLGDFNSDEVYWSSSEHPDSFFGANNAFVLYFGDGQWHAYPKTYTRYVRAIRAF